MTVKKWLKNRLRRPLQMLEGQTTQTLAKHGIAPHVVPALVDRIASLDVEVRQQKEALHHQNEVLHQALGKLASVEHDLGMPKYYYHCPIDYATESHAPVFDPPVHVEGETLPLPPPKCRPGYAPNDDALYLSWGRSDHDHLLGIISRHYGLRDRVHILDWGCSSGRVLRHFYREAKERGWKLHGVDIQAFLVEWMRCHFPPDINLLCGSTFPHLPFADASLDVIYGISVFTHTKYLWDTWLAEFRRVLKPGGLCMQTVQCETAWRFYHEHRHEDWVKNGHPAWMLAKPEIDEDFFFYGDGSCSQTFYREETIKQYWGRYMKVVEFLPPPKFSYQNWIVLQKPSE